MATLSQSGRTPQAPIIGTQPGDVIDDINHKISATQLAFNEQVMALLRKGSKEIWHRPTCPTLTFIPTAISYYVRPVACWWPHILFPGVELKCPNGCMAHLQPKGVAPARYVHGMDSGFYFSQYNYSCKTCHAKTASMGIVLPSGLDFLCPVILTHKSALSRDLQTFITSASTTGMSFSEMGKHLATLRLTKYLNCCAEFKIRLNYYLATAQAIIPAASSVSFPDFSSFDDKTGF